MVSLGRKAKLTILKSTDFGFYLDGEDLGEILMPKRYISSEMNVGDAVDVFVFLDGEERVVATTETPYVQADEFGVMKVNKIENVGAFLDWGVSKELLVPFSEQTIKMQEGKHYFVYVYVDTLTDRPVASMKIDKFLNKHDPQYKPGEKLEVLIWKVTDIGYKCITDDKFQGLLYKTEVFKNVQPGDRLTVYVKKIRNDGKIDLATEPVGREKFDAKTEKILHLMEKSGGKLPYNDKTTPEVIYRIFGMSKKVFKQSIGHLYKKRLILITDKGIETV